MKTQRNIIILLATGIGFLTGCEKEDLKSSDIYKNLLPNLTEIKPDYPTHEIANEIQGIYDTTIYMNLYYEDRTTLFAPLTMGNKDIFLKKNANGTIQISIIDFQEDPMPLKLSINIQAKLKEKGDTIFINGEDGIVRTSNKELIGYAFPESDDGIVTGYYLRSEKKIKLEFDPMLPPAMKPYVAGYYKSKL